MLRFHTALLTSRMAAGHADIRAAIVPKAVAPACSMQRRPPRLVSHSCSGLPPKHVAQQWPLVGAAMLTRQCRCPEVYIHQAILDRPELDFWVLGGHSQSHSIGAWQRRCSCGGAEKRLCSCRRILRCPCPITAMCAAAIHSIAILRWSRCSCSRRLGWEWGRHRWCWLGWLGRGRCSLLQPLCGWTCSRTKSAAQCKAVA